MQLHRQKIWTFLTVCMMIVTLLSSCGTASPPSTASNPTATATSELKLGVYKSGNGLVNAYGEKLYVQSTPELTQKYKNLPPPVQLSLSNTHYTGKQATHLIALVKQSTSSTGSCGQEGAPSDNAYNVRDVIDNLPTAASADTNVSDPFLLLASEVSYQEENSVTVTSDELINSCTEQFNPETGGIAYDLPFLNHPGNWDAILQAYQQNYPNDYQPMWDALNTFKARATKYAQDNGLPINEGQATPTPTEEPPTPTEVQPTPTDQPPTPTPTEVQPTPTQGPGSGTVGQIVEAPASILDEPDWDKHHVLMPEQEWQDTSFPESGISDATKWLDAIQLVIDMGGMVPAFSAINGVNTLIYLMRGDKLNALLSAGAMVPFVADELIGTKLAARGVEFYKDIAKITKLEKVSQATLEIISKVKNIISTKIDELCAWVNDIRRTDGGYLFATDTGIVFKETDAELGNNINKIEEIKNGLDSAGDLYKYQKKVIDTFSHLTDLEKKALKQRAFEKVLYVCTFW